MSSSFEDTVLDFDLNFLHQSANNPVVPSKVDKQRKAILIVKKKTIVTDSLIRKYYSKKELLDQTEKTLLASKEECKSICIEYKSALEKCAKLEQDSQKLVKRNQELEERTVTLENQCEAIQSHSKQLQLLVKENETKLDSMKIENHLDRGNIKEYEKKVSSLKKENDSLLDHLCIFKDVLLGKKKLSNKAKSILENYKKLSRDEISDDSCCEDDNSQDETDILDDAMSLCTDTEELLEQHENEQNNTKQHSNVLLKLKQELSGTRKLKKDDIDRESDCSNGIVSVDTGRGSSLAFSDSDKSFHSPDYFLNDSPLSAEIVSKNTKKLIEAGTSPITVCGTADASTSPIIFDQPDLPIIIVTEDPNSTTVIDQINIPRETVDNGVSPIKSILNINQAICEKNLKTKPSEESSTSPIRRLSNKISNDIECSKTLQEKVCLELNNSNNVIDDNSEDGEIEMILNTMRMTHDLVTPIPSTPSKSRTGQRSCLSKAGNNIDTSLALDNPQFECQDAAKINEDNKIMHSNIADLAKEIVSIKSLLMKHIFNQKVTSNDNLDMEQLLNDEGLIVNEEPQEIVSNELDVMDDIYDGCSTGDESDIVRLDGDESDIIRLEDLMSKPNEHLTINEQDEYEHDILHIDSEKGTLNTAQKLQFEEETEHEQPLIEENVEPPLELPTNINKDSISDRRKKLANTRKLTRLEKLRNKLVPRSKIRRVDTPTLKKLRFKPKQLPSKKTVKSSDSSASLNDKEVYDKAVKIMAALKSKKPKKDKCNFKCKNKDDFNGEFETVNCDKNGEAITNLVEEKEGGSRNSSRRLSTASSTTSVKSSIATRSRSKNILQDVKVTTDMHKEISEPGDNNNNQKESDVTDIYNTSTPKASRKRPKRSSVDKPEVENKRILRSSSTYTKTASPGKECKETTVPTVKDVITSNQDNTCLAYHSLTRNSNETETIEHIEKTTGKIDRHCVVNYSDLNVFSEEAEPFTEKRKSQEDTSSYIKSPEGSILCKMIDKHSSTTNRVKDSSKISETTINMVCRKIDDGISHILGLTSSETKQAMNKFVDDLRTLNLKHFVAGLMRYLKNPDRKNELFNKVNSPPAPPMTKSEQVLLYVVTHLRGSWPDVDIVDCILNNIEYTLFKLNRTPEFEIIESMSHFYAVLCRYIRAKSRLRLFIMDAMYCIQFKSVPLIKQCLDVWMHILPLAHMGIAKSPLVTCLIYLLHFYKCEDKFNRVQEIRNILNRKYFYKVTEWNQTKILEMFRHAIRDLKDIYIEIKMLRMALIILAKRQGPRWCENHIIKNLLQPMIEKEDVPERVKLFCISLLGPLMKPYPVDMKVHCEIVINQLVDMLDNNPSHQMEEAILTSLIFMSKHNQNRVLQVLLSKHSKQISPELEDILRNYVREKPLRIWKAILSKVPLVR